MVKRPKRDVTIVTPKKVLVSPLLSREQAMLGEMFGGSERLWGTGNNLPVIHRTIISGFGLINNDDVEEETASMFGLR